MNLVEQLNTCCRRLYHDESGVVLAFTVIVFLSLFVIACSVYAVGENIRQRIELQNAADAAAYSAAVVQADALSRIAAINKALAWTYVQMGRAVMDYDEDVWLEWIIQKWNDREDDVSTWVNEGNCPSHWVGVDFIPGLVRINQSQTLPIIYLTALYAGGIRRPMLTLIIDTSRQAIIGMNDAESDIIQQMQSRIQDTVEEVLTNDLGSPESANFIYSLGAGDASQYFTTLTDEKRFLQFFDNPTDAATVFEDGVNIWFDDSHPSDGIQRNYQQQGGSLLAEWWWFGIRFWPCYASACCIPEFYHGQMLMGQEPDDVVTGEKAKDWGGESQDYYETETVTPQVLTNAYFGSAGAITVAVARPMSNVVYSSLGLQQEPGLYGFFAPPSSDGNTPYAWAAAASRAAYKNGGADGEYWTEDPSGTWIASQPPNRGNLSQWDWDAELIPLPWVTSPQQLWNSQSWQPLSSVGSSGTALGDLASGSAPTGALLH
jgi:Na+-transporting methylmalonyl-CoA/oxaloacetate decarboxylase gamma subunit